MKKIAVLTSSSDAPGMNATIRAVVRRGLLNGLEVYGVQHGFKGLLDGAFIKMDLGSVGDTIHRGGTILQYTTLADFQITGNINQVIEQLKSRGIDGVVVIGGNDSFQGAEAINTNGIPVIVIPATIENDIPGTDYSIGFDTAVNTAVKAIDKIRDTASSHDRTYVIEVMGRHSGDIALWSGMCSGAESIIIPEVDDDIDNIINRIKKENERGKTHSIIVVAEGVEKGIGAKIGKVIQKRTGFDTKVTILGHVQRGGSPSTYDRMIGSQMGAQAVDLLVEGINGVLVGLKNGRLIHTKFEDALEEKSQLDLDIYQLARSLSI